jgi:hypothetical protein
MKSFWSLALLIFVSTTSLFTASCGLVIDERKECDDAIRQTMIFDDQYAIAIQVAPNDGGSDHLVYRVPAQDTEVYYLCDSGSSGTKLIVLEAARLDKIPPKPAEAPAQP